MRQVQQRLRTLFAVMAIGSIGMMAIGCHHEAPPPATPAPPPPPAPVAEPTPPPPRVTSTPTQDVWQQMPVSINYPSGGSRLSDEARAMMRELHASVAHRTDIIRVRVHGHADGRGSQQDNERLALERAQGVVDFLVGDLGMPRELFEIVGHGDDDPLSSGTTASDRMINRRVTFEILVRRRAAL